MELTHQQRWDMETPESIENHMRMAVLEEQEFLLQERIEQSIKEAKEKNAQVYAPVYQAIVDKYKIGSGGFNSKDPFVIDVDRLRCIKHLIDVSFRTPRKGSRNHNHGSYGLKHFVEKLLGEDVKHYVSNAELIVAMIEHGFTPSKPYGLNCNFKVDVETQFADGFKHGKSIWKKRITEKHDYDDMAIEDGQFLYDWTRENGAGFDANYDLFLRGFLYAKEQVHVFYPEEHRDNYKHQRSDNMYMPFRNRYTI